MAKILLDKETLASRFNSLNLGMDGEELTEQETALYDRQIRVWGANAQRRLSKSHILVSGIKGTVAEFCKNIVLAGVGSVTLMDDRLVEEEEALNANFLVPPDENGYKGKAMAEICCESLKEFNPMVLVYVEKGDLSTRGTDFLEKFDVVVIGYGSRATKKAVNVKCRKLSKQVAFYTVDCRDSCGEIFVDLQNYKYTKKKLQETVECEVKFPSFQEAISVPWKQIPLRTPKLYFAMRVIEVFEESEGRKPGESSLLDLPTVSEIKKQLCEAKSVSESHIPDSLLARLITGNIEFPPACAIVGGILAQEVIKAISGIGDPLKNFFYFDAQDGKGKKMEEIQENPHMRLKQQLNELEQEWSAMKTGKSSSSAVSWITVEEALGFVENSPTELMLSLQHHQACPEPEIIPIRSPPFRRKLFHDSLDDSKATSFSQFSNVMRVRDTHKGVSVVSVTVLLLFLLVVLMFNHLSMDTQIGSTLVPT